MSIDITALAWMVRRMDVSATLKSFTAVFAFLFVAMNVTTVFGFVRDLVRTDLDGSIEAGILAAAVLVALATSLTPLAFILWDWMVRQPWYALAAVVGALLGTIGLSLATGSLGFLGYATLAAMGQEEAAVRKAGAAVLVGGAIALTAWMATESRRIRRAAVWALGFFATILSIGVFRLLFEELEFDDGAVPLADYLSGAVWALLLASLGWVLLRAVRHRIVLSGHRPRELLLGALYRKGFWARLAFLTGLPSSLWHAAAMKTPAFWAFLIARPMVYAGILLAASDSESPATARRLLLAAVLVGTGHILFHVGKRLAARYIWNPDNPDDPRPAVLFLRSFEDDQLRFRRPAWKFWAQWLDLWSFRRNADEALIDEIAQYGPVVALGMPGEQRVPFGALRHYSSHDDWQRIVTDTALSARAIVISAGDTPGVRWEYELLARKGLLDKTLLLFPPSAEDDPAPSAALAAFADATGVAIDFEPRHGQHLIGLLHTDAGPTLVTARHGGASAYLVAIRAHFQGCTAAHLADPLTL